MSSSRLLAKPPTLDEFRNGRPPVRNVMEELEKRLSTLDRFAVWITERVGSMGFFLLIFTWTTLWLGWNFLAPKHLRFDPPMGFVFWLFISNVIQLMLMPLIMLGQTNQARVTDLRAEFDYEVNLCAEGEVEAVLRHLEYQNELLLMTMEKLGVTQEELAENVGEAVKTAKVAVRSATE